jgi:hypothetical protein
MGLDMYLYKKTYVQNWEHTPDERKHVITVKMGGKKRKDIKPERISEITESVGYWRKFNALHNWFVQKLADGVDDCKELYVDRNAMKELLETLEKVKSVLDNSPKKKIQVHTGWDNGKKTYEEGEAYDTDEVEELLPTAEGFFFGGTDYDEWYYNNVSETIKTFKELLEEEGGDYYYQASW